MNQANNTLKLSFQAIDTLFFRELRPHGGPGGMQLQSVFPPPARTLEGAIRTLLHDLCAPGQSVQRDGDSLTGDLSMRGPYLCWQKAGTRERLYPWPAHVWRHQLNLQTVVLAPAFQPTESDLGRVHLPELHGLAQTSLNQRDFHAPQDTWLSHHDFFALLQQPLQAPRRVLQGEGELYCREPRVGIARDTDSRSTQDGQLYQTSHIRPLPELEFALHISMPSHSDNAQPDKFAKLASHLAQGKIVRLGAEGRSAFLQCLEEELDLSPNASDLPSDFNGGIGAQVALIFTTPADFGGDWKPANFQAHLENGITTWRGYADAAQGIALEIVSVVAAKYQREGGWDSVGGLARPARALLPAGSVWFCRVLAGDASRLQGAQLGVARELGRGEIALAAW